MENEKLKGYDIENLAQILDEVRTRVTMQTFRNDESQEEDSAARSSAAATTVAGFALGMLLYMFLLIYGAMVMQSVIEEKLLVPRAGVSWSPPCAALRPDDGQDSASPR